jgi:hypothetical protein
MGEHYEMSQGTVLDRQTQLRWIHHPPTPECTSNNASCGPESAVQRYEDGASFCETLIISDYSDFRLPTVLELYMIVYPRGYDWDTVRVELVHILDAVSSGGHNRYRSQRWATGRLCPGA